MKPAFSLLIKRAAHLGAAPFGLISNLVLFCVQKPAGNQRQKSTFSALDFLRLSMYYYNRTMGGGRHEIWTL